MPVSIVVLPIPVSKMTVISLLFSYLLGKSASKSKHLAQDIQNQAGRVAVQLPQFPAPYNVAARDQEGNSKQFRR
jgi:hypothetical protein